MNNKKLVCFCVYQELDKDKNVDQVNQVSAPGVKKVGNSDAY